MGRIGTWESWKPDPTDREQQVAMLVDTSECIGCKACEVACKQWNQNEARIAQEPGTYQSHPNLDAQTWTVIKFTETDDENGMTKWLMQKHNCMHCTEAGCVTACPTDCLHYDDYGIVSLNQEKCIGCGYCEPACPFDAIHVDKTAFRQTAQKAGKCTLCFDRVSNAMQPACVSTCPTDCIKYGDRAELIKWGKERVKQLQGLGYKNANLYGENELGGLHELYVLLESPAVYGLPVNPTLSKKLTIWKYGLQPVGKALLGTALFGFVLNWVAARKNFKNGAAHAESAGATMHD
jgi:formate dehydrogenase iron-sulfur subunit